MDSEYPALSAMGSTFAERAAYRIKALTPATEQPEPKAVAPDESGVEDKAVKKRTRTPRTKK